ncbi:hypothetical protein ILUMI_19049 [Ignelater luminosus]|uniref:Odorant receptor n=1 Tax=Ignelater luminosus TaxID=2038154 RepID=A0A8K0CGV9_IGNLU|nr:hypothetical protein ILUMI_19049 [Ignelater luminosus]
MDQVLIAEIPKSVKWPFLALSKFGLFSTNKLKVYIPITTLVLMLASIVLIAMLQFLNVKKDISDIVFNLECVLGFSVVLLRMVIVTYRSKDFTRLVNTIKLFWDTSICDQQTKAELISMRRFTYQLQRLLFLAMLIAVGLAMVASVVQNTTPAGVWTMEGHERLYRFVMITQIIVSPFSGFFICHLDCLYLGLCTEIVIQFRILSRYLQDLTADGKSEIKAYVTHHRLILRFVKEFLQAFSLVLLLEVIIDGPLICAELLAAFQSMKGFREGVSTLILNCKFICFSRYYQVQARHVTTFTFFTLQLGFFCIPANYITNEAMAVSDAVYFSKWYSQHIPHLKVPLLLMIQNSQNQITIKGGNLVTINADTIVNVLKVAWSACSLMRGLRQN